MEQIGKREYDTVVQIIRLKHITCKDQENEAKDKIQAQIEAA